ncbi:MAG: 4Fe-4S binding protein [Nitrospirae bacterium]|nr:4Fe-4S binding protein [Nitrospirota bacterium]
MWPKMTMRSWRWITETLQAILIVGLPFIKIRGESAFRFDIPTLRLHVFGCTIWIQEFFIVLVAAIFLTLLIVFITLVFGRIWCGWLCPQTVLVDFTAFVDKTSRKGLGHSIASYAITFLISAIVAASLIWYFVSPYDFIPAFLSGTLGATTWGFWIVLTAIIFLNYALLRHKFCSTVCPYAKLQSVLFDKSTLIIELEPDRAAECIDCRSCEKVCPTGIDIRHGIDAACINCAECIDACNRVMSRSGKKGLIRYAFGPGGGGRVLRPNSFLAGSFVVIFFALYVYISFARVGIDVAVLPHDMQPRTTEDQKVINAYVLSIKNMLDKPVDLNVTVEKFDETLIQSIKGPIHVKAGGMDRYPLFLFIRKSPAIKGTRTITITVDDAAAGIHIKKEAHFVIPDKL